MSVLIIELNQQKKQRRLLKSISWVAIISHMSDYQSISDWAGTRPNPEPGLGTVPHSAIYLGLDLSWKWGWI